MTDAGELFGIEEIADGLRLTGELDASTCPPVRTQLTPRIQPNGRLKVDLAGVTFIDSSGLRVLIDAHREAEARDGRLILSNPSRVVLRLFEISGLLPHLHIESDGAESATTSDGSSPTD
jgi:anti-anti-sigma factor